MCATYVPRFVPTGIGLQLWVLREEWLHVAVCTIAEEPKFLQRKAVVHVLFVSSRLASAVTQQLWA